MSENSAKLWLPAGGYPVKKNHSFSIGLGSGFVLGVSAALLLVFFVLSEQIFSAAGTFLSLASSDHPALEVRFVQLLQDGVLSEAASANLLASYGYTPALFYPLFYPVLRSGLVLLSGGTGLIAVFAWYRQKKRKQKMQSLLDVLSEKDHSDLPQPELLLQEGDFGSLASQIRKAVNDLKEARMQLKRQEDRFEETLASAAHQLKTPTSSMILLSEIMEPQNIPLIRRKMKKQLDRIVFLEDSLLALARIDHHTLRFNRAEIQLDLLIDEALFMLSEQIREKSLHIEFFRQPVFVSADPEWTLQALLNLLKNAVEASPEQGVLFLQLQDFITGPRLEIRDQGPGIDPADLPHLFERFYQGANSSKNGCGIGLPLAKELLEAQNASLRVLSPDAGGAVCIVRFYRS